MNKEKKPHKTTILDRFRRAAEAFRGKPYSSLELGLNIKRCDQCEKEYTVHCAECLYYHGSETEPFVGYCHGHRFGDPIVSRDPWDFCSRGCRK